MGIRKINLGVSQDIKFKELIYNYDTGAVIYIYWSGKRVSLVKDTFNDMVVYGYKPNKSERSRINRILKTYKLSI